MITEILLSPITAEFIFATGILSAMVLLFTITRYRAIAVTSFDLAIALIIVAGYLSFDLLVILSSIESIVVAREVLIITSRITRFIFPLFIMYVSIQGYRRQRALEKEEGQWPKNGNQ